MSKAWPTLEEWPIGSQHRVLGPGILRKTKNVWRVCASVGSGSDRSRTYETITGSLKDALDAQDRLVKEERKKPGGPSARTPFAAWLDDWLDKRINDPGALHRKPARTTTVARYRGLVEKYVIPLSVPTKKPDDKRMAPLGDIPICDVKPFHVRAVVAAMQKAGASAASMRQCRAVLRVSFNDALYEDLVTVNPTLAVKVSDEERPEIQPPSITAVDRLLTLARTTRYWLPILVARYTGMRRGEVLGVKWTAFDPERGSLAVMTNLQRTLRRGADGTERWGLELLTPKTDRSKRTIFLPPFVIAALKAHKIEQDERRMAAGSAWQGVMPDPAKPEEIIESEWAGLIFTDDIGRPMDVEAFSKAFKRFAKQAGLPNTRLHDLRHGVATALIDQGEDLKTVSDWLGHKDPAFTARVYGHSSDAKREAAAGRLERAFGRLGEQEAR